MPNTSKIDFPYGFKFGLCKTLSIEHLVQIMVHDRIIDNMNGNFSQTDFPPSAPESAIESAPVPEKETAPPYESATPTV